MSEERKLIQQLRDALNEYQPCDHANTEIVSAGWRDCKQCGELIRPAHYARDREDAARVAEIIAAADAYLALPEPPQKPTTHIYTAEEHAEVEKLRALVNQSLEAMQWILGGEPIDTLMIDAVNAITLHQAQQSKKGGGA